MFSKLCCFSNCCAKAEKPRLIISDPIPLVRQERDEVDMDYTARYYRRRQQQYGDSSDTSSAMEELPSVTIAREKILMEYRKNLAALDEINDEVPKDDGRKYGPIATASATESLTSFSTFPDESIAELIRDIKTEITSKIISGEIKDFHVSEEDSLRSFSTFEEESN